MQIFEKIDLSYVESLGESAFKSTGFKLSEAEGLRPFRTPRSRIAGI